MTDFFISYNSADKAWADWIAQQLEEEGYTTVVQAWDFPPGRNFVADMQQAAKDAACILAVLSPNYLDAQRIQSKWLQAFAHDPLGTQGLLRPIRVEACNLPDWLAGLAYIDLVRLAPADVKARLLAELARERAEPETSIPARPPASEPPAAAPGAEPEPSSPSRPPPSETFAAAPGIEPTTAWQAMDIEDLHQQRRHKQTLIRTYNRQLQKLEEQQATHGLTVPPSILIQIEDLEHKIETLTEELGEIQIAMTIAGTSPASSGRVHAVPETPPADPETEAAPLDPDDLDSPEGVVDLDSPFYIERRSDRRFRRQMTKSGTTTTIIGARQMGKTSLLIRGIEAARQKDAAVIFFDFQMVQQADLQELDGFLHHLALNIAIQTGVSPGAVDAVWQTPLGPKEQMSRFMEDHLLQHAAGSIILAIDEADRLAESAFRREFFSLVRAWHSMRAYNPVWKKISVALVISTEPYLLIDNVNQSPFNVGSQIRLGSFSPAQVQELNERHGRPLTEAQLSEMMTLLGGLPYLVRKAFYTLIDEEMTWTELTASATQPFGPFGAHLRHYTQKLQQQKPLVEAIKTIAKNQTSSDEAAVSRLMSAGLIKQEGGLYKFHCQLYDQYFRSVFTN